MNKNEIISFFNNSKNYYEKDGKFFIKYIRKYDFVHYFTLNTEERLWPTALIVKYITEKVKGNDEQEEDDDLENELDSFDFFKENKDLQFEKDYGKDPKIFEGNLIDKQCKDFIINQYPGYRVFDLESYRLDVQKAKEQTLQILKENDKAILFQPTFFYKNNIAIAKPDALIKDENGFTLIETKGTTSSKISHVIDVYYQNTVVNDALNREFNNTIDNIFLCLVAYEKAKVGTVPMILTPYAVLTATGRAPGEKQLKELTKFSDEYIDLREKYKIGELPEKSQNTLLSIVNKHKEIKNVINEVLYEDFDKILEKLLSTEVCLNPSFSPCANYFNPFKKLDFLLDLKKLWSKDEEKELFSFSGNLVRNKVALAYYLKGQYDYLLLDRPLKDTANSDEKYLKNYDNIYPWKVSDKTRLKINELKNKKVYFDFESINIATRVIDETLPFMQTVNQVSIIFDNGDKILRKKNNNIGCDNIVIDPIGFNTNDYKQIIDAILPNDNGDEYSYVVYNKSFETNRLTEMSLLINEKEYFDKVHIINSNIYDLADLFDIRKEGSIITKELKGYYSIKKVLPLVEQYRKDIFEQTGCKDYHTLSIGNGKQAQDASTQRFFKLLNNDEWKEKVNNLKIYCENDVRAMVAVEYFVRSLFD